MKFKVILKIYINKNSPQLIIKIVDLTFNCEPMVKTHFMDISVCI